VAALLLLVLGFKSSAQTRWWRDDITLWSGTLELRPESPVALINLGFANNQRGNKERALALYRQAVKAAPWDPVARNNLGALLAEQGRQDLAGWSSAPPWPIIPTTWTPITTWASYC
jgi:tetratricopeptide (TPR) repeat protein